MAEVVESSARVLPGRSGRAASKHDVEASSHRTAPAGATTRPEARGAAAAPRSTDDATTPRLRLDHPLVQDIMFDPRRWRIWPTVAVLRWLLRQAPIGMQRIVYRSLPSLKFATSEIEDVAIQTSGNGGVELTLAAPGLATDGSPLPSSDIARIIADRERGGGLSMWLDMPADRFMHLAEQSLARHSAAFALATGGDIHAVSAAADLVGRSAPLSAQADGVLTSVWDREPIGAAGLAAMFMGPPSAAGLSGALGAFTSLPVEVEEFKGAEVPILRPTRVGGRFGSMLGSKCHLPAAGIDVVVQGGTRRDAQSWAGEPQRRASLYRLAHAYVGAHAPRTRIFLSLDPRNAPPARLGRAAFGGLAVLGEAKESVRLPLAGWR